MHCKRCGAENQDDANFCEKCAGKLKETCNCWVKKEPYNCGQDQCPGYRLFQMEKQLQAKGGRMDEQKIEEIRKEALLETKDYLKAIERLEKEGKKAAKKQRRQEMLELLGGILLALLTAAPFAFILACLAAKMVSG